MEKLKKVALFTIHLHAWWLPCRQNFYPNQRGIRQHATLNMSENDFIKHFRKRFRELIDQYLTSAADCSVSALNIEQQENVYVLVDALASPRHQELEISWAAVGDIKVGDDFEDVWVEGNEKGVLTWKEGYERLKRGENWNKGDWKFYQNIVRFSLNI